MKKSKILGGILLVSGTAIGAGMLALPISTASNGFFPSALTFLVCWMFMTVAALLVVEVNLHLPGEKDFISMVSLTLGLPGKIIAWVGYLLLLYALISAYLMGGSSWLLKLLSDFNITWPLILALSIMVVIFGTITSYGTALTDHINRYFVFGLVIAYFILIVVAFPSIEIEKIKISNFDNISKTLPLVTTAFGFSVILPSLTNYLERDIRVLRLVVIVGGLIPLLIYLLWQLVTLGIIPLTGQHSFQQLAETHDNGTGVAFALEHLVQNAWITQSSRWFAIFAMLTSLLGISLALFHFLADGLKVNPKKTSMRLLLLLLTFIPPVLVVLFYPSGFSRILSFAGLFVSVLLGILPVIMVWRMRYANITIAKKAVEYRVWGGKCLLIVVLCFFTYISYLEIANCLLCRS